jgi:hypothetical protein
MHCTRANAKRRHDRIKMVSMASELFLPKRLLSLVEDVKARQSHMCQIAVAEILQLIPRPNAFPPFGQTMSVMEMH